MVGRRPGFGRRHGPVALARSDGSAPLLIGAAPRFASPRPDQPVNDGVTAGGGVAAACTVTAAVWYSTRPSGSLP